MWEIKSIRDDSYSTECIIRPIYAIEIKTKKRRYRIGWMANCGTLTGNPWYGKIGHLKYDHLNGYFKIRILWLAFAWLAT